MAPSYNRRGRGGRGRGGGANENEKDIGLSKKEKNKTFEEFYTEVYGKDRWPALRRAMTQEPAKIALYNRFCQLPFAEVTRGLVRLDPDALTQAFVLSSTTSAENSAESNDKSVAQNTSNNNNNGNNGNNGDNQKGDEEAPKEISPTTEPTMIIGGLIPKPPQDDFHTRGYYLMDYASALVVEQLHVGPFDRVLDLCAAPGGKSIAIAQFLSPDGHLSSNETRGDRCARLRRNLQDHVPNNFVPWTVTQRNAETWHDPGQYTRVLVDAPCSSERHLLHQTGGAMIDPRDWQLESTQKLARLQLSLLQRALETCAEGGRVVYSTCSISPFENDEVVAKALRTTRCGVEVLHPSKPSPPTAVGDETNENGGAPRTPLSSCGHSSHMDSESDYEDPGNKGPRRCHTANSKSITVPPIGAPTALGWMILPDTCNGWGPMYFSVLYKTRHQKVVQSSSESDSDE